MQTVTRLAVVVLLLHAAVLVSGSLYRQSHLAQGIAPGPAELYTRGAQVLEARGYQRVTEPPLRSKLFLQHDAFRAPGCGRSLWLFVAPVSQNTRQYVNAQGLGAYAGRFYFEGVASDFPNGWTRHWTLYWLKIRYLLGLGPRPAEHFLMLAIPVECAQTDVDLRPAFQRP